jgi:hypothetical protein
MTFTELFKHFHCYFNIILSKIIQIEAKKTVSERVKKIGQNWTKVGNYFKKVHLLGKVVLKENT